MDAARGTSGRMLPRVAALVCCICAGAAAMEARAGVYGGYQANGEGSRVSFVGLQTGPRVVFDLFAARVEYEYLVDGATVDARQLHLAPTVGWRWGSERTATLLAGPIFIDKEEGGARQSDTTTAGATVKLGLYAPPAPLGWDALVSYTTTDSLLWSRARIRRAMTDDLALGAEARGMTGDDAHSYGAGGVLELGVLAARLSLSLGYERSTNGEGTVYGGVEVSAFF